MLELPLQASGVEGVVVEEGLKVVVGCVIGVFAVLAKERYYSQKSNSEDLNELQSVIFGLEGMEGVIEVLESHDESIERIHERVDGLRSDLEDESERIDNIERRLGDLVDRCRERGKDGK